MSRVVEARERSSVAHQMGHEGTLQLLSGPSRGTLTRFGLPTQRTDDAQEVRAGRHIPSMAEVSFIRGRSFHFVSPLPRGTPLHLRKRNISFPFAARCTSQPGSKKIKRKKRRKLYYSVALCLKNLVSKMSHLGCRETFEWIYPHFCAVIET